MLKSIMVENYRGFKRETILELRPLTILLGKNSSGKSSLTRIIPLLQQSTERQTSSPILWSSESVDLGNISDVITHGDSVSELRIGIRVSAPRLLFMLARFKGADHSFERDAEGSTLEYIIRLSADGTSTRFRGFEIVFEDQRLGVEWDDEGYITNFEVNMMSYHVDDKSYSVNSKTFIPQISAISANEEIARSRRAPMFYAPFVDVLKSVLHGRVSEEKRHFLARRFPFIPVGRMKEFLSRYPNSVTNKINSESCRRISDTSMINSLPHILLHLEGIVAETLAAAAYIGPVRASASRFNRIQELAVTRINASGDNTAMYIHSLSERELDSFNELMVRACGHRIAVSQSGSGHVSINIGRHGQAHLENIADVGFGFSQLLPVVAQLHAVRERLVEPNSWSADNVVFAVEQPELHLHPAMQANLADLFVGAIKTGSESGPKTTILVETHSETLLSQVGLLVSGGDISKDEVAIYFVNKDEATGESTLKEVSFDDSGVINEWPVGFFSMS